MDEIVQALVEIEMRFESRIFDEYQRKDADRILTELQEIIAIYLNELKNQASQKEK